MMRALGIAAFATACGAAKPIGPPRTAVLEGRVTDSMSGVPMSGVPVYVGGVCRYGAGYAQGVTDANGHYRIELAPGACQVAAFFYAWVDPRTFRLADHGTARIDLEIDRDDLIAYNNPLPMNCPSSPKGTVIEGKRASQTDLDAIAHAVLSRFADDPKAIRDETYRRGDEVLIQREVGDRKGMLGPDALPADAVHFVLRTNADLVQGGTWSWESSGKPLRFVEFFDVSSDGSCAVVNVGVGAEPNTFEHHTCTCVSSDIYEKRDGRWIFVRSAHASCG